MQPSLQHALLWQAMRALRADGATRYFELGREAATDEEPKAQRIAFFKRGFGGTPWPVCELAWGENS